MSRQHPHETHRRQHQKDADTGHESKDEPQAGQASTGPQQASRPNLRVDPGRTYTRIPLASLLAGDNESEGAPDTPLVQSGRSPALEAEEQHVSPLKRKYSPTGSTAYSYMSGRTDTLYSGSPLGSIASAQESHPEPALLNLGSLNVTSPVSQTSARAQDTTPFDTSRFQLQILQQPQAARISAEFEKDRRLVDPPPILQLSLRDFSDSDSRDIAELKDLNNMVMAELFEVVTTSFPETRVDNVNVTVVSESHDSSVAVKRLIGTLHKSPFVTTDVNLPARQDGRSPVGVYFIFDDLKCRYPGIYRLKFTLWPVRSAALASSSSMSSSGLQFHSSTSCWTDPFRVYPPKEFPGMTATSDLLRRLIAQGVRTTVRGGRERQSALSQSQTSPN